MLEKFILHKNWRPRSKDSKKIYKKIVLFFGRVQRGIGWIFRGAFFIYLI